MKIKVLIPGIFDVNPFPCLRKTINFFGKEMFVQSVTAQQAKEGMGLYRDLKMTLVPKMDRNLDAYFDQKRAILQAIKEAGETSHE